MGRIRVRIRPITSPSELVEVEELQRKVWGMDDVDVVPAHMMVAALMCGGLVLGAYDEEGRLIGFVFGIAGLRGGRLVHHSHMAGVLPEARYRGVGYQLKLAQREHVLRQGFELIEWTFDPLRAPNARLNLTKLGGVSATYLENLYGALRDELDRGVPSDRLLVEWWLRSERVLSKLEGRLRPPSLEELLEAGVVLANDVKLVSVRGRVIEDVRRVRTDLNSSGVLVRIPADDQLVRRASPEAYVRWRLALRRALTSYLSRGYVAVELISEVVDGRRENYYLLVRASLEDVLREGESYFNLL